MAHIFEQHEANIAIIDPFFMVKYLCAIALDKSITDQLIGNKLKFRFVFLALDPFYQ